MTKEQILRKAISKAVKGGFVFKVPVCKNQYQNIIFSHDFAKAFFGEAIDHNFIEQKTEAGYKCKCGLWEAEWDGDVCEEGWQYHLQQMVLEKDRIKYLEKFL